MAKADIWKKPLWKFRTRNFVVEWRIERDEPSVNGLDYETKRDVLAGIRSGRLKCFTAVVTVHERSTNAELAAEQICNCIYEDPREFRDHLGMNKRGHGSYFSQMVREACRAARPGLEEWKRGRARRDAELEQTLRTLTTTVQKEKATTERILQIELKRR
jgi:hypothetical protein